MNPLYPTVAERAENRCEYCRAPEQVFNFAFEVEHIHLRSEGGATHPDNLALACESCNLFKTIATTGWDADTQQEAVLFHPRRDLWEVHFRYDTETDELHGRTPTGRATVTRLKLNSGFQLRARQQWRRLNLYP